MTTLWVTVLDPSGTLENKETTILAPNPAYDHILIHEKGLRQVDILDTTGKKVFTSASGDDELRIDLTCLQAGIYLVNIITDRGSSVQKMVKR